MFFLNSGNAPAHFWTSCHLLWVFVPTLNQKKTGIITSNTKRGLTRLFKGRRLAPRGGIGMKDTKKAVCRWLFSLLDEFMHLDFPLNQTRKGANHDQ